MTDLYVKNRAMRTPTAHTLIALFEQAVGAQAAATNVLVKGSGGGGTGGGGTQYSSLSEQMSRAQRILAREVAQLGADILLDLAERHPAALLSSFVPARLLKAPAAPA